MKEENAVEVVEARTIDKEIISVLEHSGLEKPQAEQVMEGFRDFFEEIKGYENEAKAIVITDATQLTEMKKAREIRLRLKAIRVNAEKVRKERKEFFLRGGKAIDGLANVLKALVVPLEEHLDKQENFALRMEEERKERVNLERIEALRPYVPDVSLYPLKDMTEDGFQVLLNNSKLAYEAGKKAEEEAEKKRLADEEAKRIEDERIRKENEDLKREAEEKEKARAEEKRIADAEKAEADRKLAEAEAEKKKAEDEKKKAEADLKAKQEEEDRKKREADEKAKRDAEEQAKREKAEDYRKFRSELGWSEDTKADYKEENTGDSIILWKKAGVFKIK